LKIVESVLHYLVDQKTVSHREAGLISSVEMDYSYLNQAAASFDSTCLQSMDPTGLNMPCSYGDITSCNQMSQAAYRASYTAAATMARSYGNPVGNVGPGNGMSALHHSGTPVTQCSVRQDVHRASMFPSSMNLQCKLFICSCFKNLKILSLPSIKL
jgi:paired mesoderm homeobox protein 2